ncbi:MAG TPA: outer membrane protein transport protein [Candidatus Rikenella faecigallinarum]|uniref:Outer membrane protein transport protein n=1 Tax=Candidatus Rikenella faecigallinarum TaxID=2838745 RepID=A0A9D1TXZ5_9BACT|nr:outer membrane protein transport protein [Candidatus Rikenella faecigallinarum]
MPNPKSRTLIHYRHTRSVVRTVIGLWSVVCLLCVVPARAQISDLNIFSPYTMYGIGDLAVGGNAFNRPMGGVGIAIRDPYTFNYRNPASMSVIPRQSAIFNFSGEGKNIYAKNDYTSTTYNTFNIHDLGLAVPLGRGIGLGFSLTPVSSVGYTSRLVYNNPSIDENIGSTIYNYAGDGGISQVAMHFGINVTPQLSLGASMNYWFGNIERQYNSMVTSYLDATVYRSVVSSENQNLSKILFTFGAQYAFKVGQGNALILGVTYQPKTTASIKQTRLTLSYNTTVSDTVYSGSSRWDMDIPAKLAAGVSFQTNKLTVAFDYSRQNWKGAFEIPKDQDITLGLQQDFRLGASYTPNRYDIRNALNRWTYKAGVRYSTSYLSKAGHQLSDAAVSIGVDFGLKKGTFSKVGIGVEYGERGSRAAGQVRERYFNIVAALSLFGKDYWFVRPKYN